MSQAVSRIIGKSADGNAPENFVEPPAVDHPEIGSPYPPPCDRRQAVEEFNVVLNEEELTTVMTALEHLGNRQSPSNYRSAYDSLWFHHYRSETSFYAAIPYGDLEHGHTKANAVMCPWYRQAYQGDGVSILKDRWIAIRSGSKVAYCQIKDVGPYHTDDTGYVWQNQRPLAHDNNQAGLDISPAAQQYLGLGGLSVTDWKFVDNPPPGPWLIRDNSIAFKK
jgi:hypothetical protein